MLDGHIIPLILDYNAHAGGIPPLYVREDIPSNILLVEENPTKGFFVNVNLRNKKKCLIRCSYNSKKNFFIKPHCSIKQKNGFIYYQIWAFTNLRWLQCGNGRLISKNICSNFNLTSMMNKTLVAAKIQINLPIMYFF